MKKIVHPSQHFSPCPSPYKQVESVSSPPHKQVEPISPPPHKKAESVSPPQQKQAEPKLKAVCP